MIYLSSSEKFYTLAYGIYKRLIIGGGTNTAHIRCAVGVFMAAPSAILFFIFQKQLIEGVTVGAIKG